MIGLRLRPDIRRQIEAWAKQNDLSFSDAVRQLLEIGLEHVQEELPGTPRR